MWEYIYIWDVRWDIWTMVPWWPNWLWTSVHPSLNHLKSKDQNLKIQVAASSVGHLINAFDSSCRLLSQPCHQGLQDGRTGSLQSLSIPEMWRRVTWNEMKWLTNHEKKMTNDQPHQPLIINIGIIEKDWMPQALNRPSLHRQLPKNSPASVVQSFWQSWSWLGGHSRNLFYKCLASTPNWICFSSPVHNCSMPRLWRNPLSEVAQLTARPWARFKWHEMPMENSQWILSRPSD